MRRWILIGVLTLATPFPALGGYRIEATPVSDQTIVITEDKSLFDRGYVYWAEERPEEVEAEPEPSYTEEELYILAHLICGEAQHCDRQEQLYVGSVVLNRVSDGRFPGAIKEVVFQRGQYACTWDGNYYREPTAENWEVAGWLLENGSQLPANVVWQSQRGQGKGTYIKTRWHYYCY